VTSTYIPSAASNASDVSKFSEQVKLIQDKTHPTKKLNLRLRGDGTYRNDACLPIGFDLTREFNEYGGHDDDDDDNGYGYYDYDYADYEEFDWDGFSNEYCALCCSKTCSNYVISTFVGVACV